MWSRVFLVCLVLAVTACQESPQPPQSSEASTPDVFFKKNQAEWDGLRQYLGQNPQDIDLWERAPLKHALRLLLGPQLDTFKQHMQKSSPLLQDRVLYISGSSKDDDKQQAYLLIDVENRKLEVGMINHGQLEVLTTPGESIYFPPDLQPMLKKLTIRM